MKFYSKIIIMFVVFFSAVPCLFAQSFYSINRSTDQLITINFDNGEVNIIGDIGFNVFYGNITTFRNRLFMIHNSDRGGSSSNKIELIEINPVNGAIISVKAVQYNGNDNELRLAEGFFSTPDTMKISFSIDGDHKSEFIGDISTDGVISNEVYYANADFDSIGINPQNNDLIGIDMQTQKTVIYKLNNDKTLTKLFEFYPSEFIAVDFVFWGSICYSLNHNSNKLHSVNFDTGELLKTTTINVGSGHNLSGFAKLLNDCNLLDTDGDGVIDQWDNCPETPLNSYVNSLGCPLLDNSALTGRILMKGQPLRQGSATLFQSGELFQKSSIDNNGCYNFENISEEKSINIMIRKPVE